MVSQISPSKPFPFHHHFSQPPPFLKRGTIYVVKLTPCMVVSYYIGFWGLGYAYKHHIMMKIQMYAINFIFPYVGYLGLGAAMPWIDWIASRFIFSVCFFMGGTICLCIEKVIYCVWTCIFSKKSPHNSPLSPVKKDI